MTERPRDVGVVLVAAGSGRRFGGRKQFLSLLGRPLLEWSLEAVAAARCVREVVVVFAEGDLAAGRAILAGWEERRRADGGGRGAEPQPLGLRAVRGGARRQDSALLGVEALGEAVEVALVHDAARPLIGAHDFERVAEAVRAWGAAALGTPSVDSLKRARDGVVVEELSREEVWAVQTPQGGRRKDLLRAYREAASEDLTDEASALRAAGIVVRLVEGSRENLKITRPGDERLAEQILRARGEA